MAQRDNCSPTTLHLGILTGDACVESPIIYNEFGNPDG